MSMLFFSPPEAPGVDRVQLSRLIDRICDEAIQGGTPLVQALIERDDAARTEVLTESGLILLADLIYMSRNLLERPSALDRPEDRLTWRNYKQFTEAELADVISRSYVDSLDCPALRGVREMPDVIAGHKSSGMFRPEAWWIVDCDTAAAGCILVNDSANGMHSDIIYMGLAPEFRRRRLAAVMLDKVISQAFERQRHAISVAVDRRNHPALRAYQQRRFVEIRSRLAYVKLKSRS